MTTAHPKHLSVNGELPSLPQIILRMMHACNQDADYRELAQLISSDTALSARVLSLANSAFFNQGKSVNSIERALLRLGLENIRTLVITAALRQFLQDLGADHWQQVRDFWRHSLATALLARALAVLTRYSYPDEAYLVGMLHNIGELISLQASATGSDSPPVTLSQVETAALLVKRWGLGPLASDAVRYQQEPPEEVWDTPHLVKLINLSTRLAMSDKRGLEAANTLFGLTAALTREICSRVDQEVDQLAQTLNIPLEGETGATEVRQALLTELINQGLVNETTSLLRKSADEVEFAKGLLNSVEQLCDCPAIVFIVADKWLEAQAVSGWPELSLRVPRTPARSLIARAVKDNLVLNTFDNAQDTPVVIEQQLMDLLNRQHLLCIPLSHHDQVDGLLVLGCDQPLPASQRHLMIYLANEAAALRTRRGQRQRSRDDARTLAQMEQDLGLRRMIHEISNPLTIVRNYVTSLQQKLAEDEALTGDLKVIREELDRAADLLLQLRDRQEPAIGGDTTDINEEVSNLSELLQTSLFSSHDVECRLKLDQNPPLARVTRGPLRQVMVNLIRNAVEAMPDGGMLSIETATQVWQSNRNWIEIFVSDTGPGLPQPVLANLFQPTQTAKGPGHSGLGLSIVKQLVDDMDGVISCRTGSDGTRFRILLPAADGERADQEA